jgi:hypothetical protein
LQIADEPRIDDLRVDALEETVLKAKFGQLLHEKRSREWSELCQVRRVPDVASLISDGQLQFADVTRVRKTNACQRFRKWLHTQSEENPPAEIVSAYIDALVAKKPVDRPAIKAVRIALTNVLGLIPAIGSLVSLAAYIVDSFVLDRLLGGWTPSTFLDEEYAKYVGEQQ